MSGSVRTLQAEHYATVRAKLGEGPAWDARSGRLSFVDIMAGRLHQLEDDGAATVLCELDVWLGAAIPSSKQGEFLLVTHEGFRVLAADGSVRPVLDVLGERPELRFNDARCDPAGRCFAGTASQVDAPSSAALYRLDPGPVASEVVGGVGLSNGLGWSTDGSSLYYTDTLSGRVDRFDYDSGTGELGARYPFVREQSPDGLCLDDEGGVWIALWGGAEVHRYRPDGVLDTVVRVPVPNPTSCTFAGSLLVITTAWNGMTEAERSRSPQSGDLFAVHCGLSGPATVPWRAEAVV